MFRFLSVSCALAALLFGAGATFAIASENPVPTRGQSRADDTAERARLVCTNRLADLGEIARALPVSNVFHMVNSGEKTLIITHIQACCGLSARVTETNVPPGGKTELQLVLHANQEPGPLRKTIYLHTNDPEAKIVAFRLAGTVRAGPPAAAPVGGPQPGCGGCR